MRAFVRRSWIPKGASRAGGMPPREGGREGQGDGRRADIGARGPALPTRRRSWLWVLIAHPVSKPVPSAAAEPDQNNRRLIQAVHHDRHDGGADEVRAWSDDC